MSGLKRGDGINMAIPKFPLKMQDGAQVRSIEGLRDHADLWTLEQGFRSGRLVRWLTVWHYEDLAETLRRLDGEGCGLRRRLCKVLGISYSEQMEADYRARAAEVKASEAKAAEAPEASAEESTIPEPSEVRRSVVMNDEVADRVAEIAEVIISKLPSPDENIPLDEYTEYYLQWKR